MKPRLMRAYARLRLAGKRLTPVLLELGQGGLGQPRDLEQFLARDVDGALARDGRSLRRQRRGQVLRAFRTEPKYRPL